MLKKLISSFALCTLFLLANNSYAKSPEDRFFEQCKQFACKEECQSMLEEYENAKADTQRFKKIISQIATESAHRFRLSRCIFSNNCFSNANRDDGILPLIQETEELIEKRQVDINTTDADGLSILEAAVSINSPTFVQWLLDHGMSPNATGLDDCPVLITAASMNSDKAVRVLLGAGADPNAQYDGMTALDCAREDKNKTIITLLAEHTKNDS